MAEWNLLPKELVHQISGHLKTSIDLLRFRSVCSSWRSSVSPISPAFFHPLNCPYLGLLNRRIVFLISPPDSTSPRSSSSWLVKIDGEQESPKQLLNPLSRYRFNSFPSGFPRHLDLRNFRILELFEEYFVRLNELTTLHPEKVAIQWLNGGSQFLLLARGYTSILALYESAGEKWTLLDDIAQPLCHDVIVYNDRLYAVDANGKTVLVGPNADLELVANPIFEGSSNNLVECRGQLLLVVLYRSSDPGIWKEGLPKNPTGYVSARVFKLDEESQGWIAVECLEDQVLFLGEDSNFSLSAADLSGCSGNCIFFLDNYEYEAYDKPKEEAGVLLGRDIGVFELGTGSMGLLSSYPEYAKMFLPPPDWISSASLEE